MNMLKELYEVDMFEGGDKRALTERIYNKLKALELHKRKFAAPDYLGLAKFIVDKFTPAYIDAVKSNIKSVDDMPAGLWVSSVVTKMRQNELKKSSKRKTK